MLRSGQECRRTWAARHGG